MEYVTYQTASRIKQSALKIDYQNPAILLTFLSGLMKLRQRAIQNVKGEVPYTLFQSVFKHFFEIAFFKPYSCFCNKKKQCSHKMASLNLDSKVQI